MLRDRIDNDYFEWLSDIVCRNRFSDRVSYKKLLRRLHQIEFRYSIAHDANRAEDGIDLRYRFAYDYPGIEDAERYLGGPCSILEMMVALAIRCEETIMDDPRYGNRTGQWFWGMVVNLGLGSMSDGQYNEQRVNEAIEQFLDREYSPDGRGGLFTVRNARRDLRDVEIWVQLLWYLDKIIV